MKVKGGRAGLCVTALCNHNVVTSKHCFSQLFACSLFCWRLAALLRRTITTTWAAHGTVRRFGVGMGSVPDRQEGESCRPDRAKGRASGIVSS